MKKWVRKLLGIKPVKRKYSWKKDKKDERDLAFTHKLKLSILPPKVDLSDGVNYVFDQGELGSCTANSIAMAIDYIRAKEGMPVIIPSRLFIYYNERDMEGTIPEDDGAQIRDGIKSVDGTNIGVCRESVWPYNISVFATKPSVEAYNEAKQYGIKQYRRIDNTSLIDMKACLAGGFPFVFGFTVYSEFEGKEVARTGIVPMPSDNSQQLGGHAVCCVGYDDSTQMFKVKNSWGNKWGDGGYFYIPYNYLTSNVLANDFWEIQLV